MSMKERMRAKFEAKRQEQIEQSKALRKANRLSRHARMVYDSDRDITFDSHDDRPDAETY